MRGALAATTPDPGRRRGARRAAGQVPATALRRVRRRGRRPRRGAGSTAALVATRGEGIGPLRARMAVHTGEAEERDGDYFGTAVNRVARLMAIGHGGQVLLSQATAGLPGVRNAARPRRAPAARPLPSRARVSARRRRTSRPTSLRSVPRRAPTNLPAQLTSLRRPGARRPSGRPAPPRGPPGDAHRARRGRQDPARRAGGRRGPRPLPGRRVARRAGARRRAAPRECWRPRSTSTCGRRERRIGPLGALRSRRLLLVLDNCEHVLGRRAG